MSAALALVKRELGVDAVILGTRTLRGRGLDGLVGGEQVEISAAPPETVSVAPRVTQRSAASASQAPHPKQTQAPATPSNASGKDATRVQWPSIASKVPEYAEVERIDQLLNNAARQKPTAARQSPPQSPPPTADDAPPAPHSNRAIAKQLEPFYHQLVQSEVSRELARRIVTDAARSLPRGASLDADQIAGALRRCIAQSVPATGGVQLVKGEMKRVALVGPAGGGKTTTLAKLAAQFKLKHKKNVAILSLDMQRMAAHAQVQRYGELIGVPVYPAQTAMEVKEALHQVGEVDLLLIDTPGVGLRETSRFTRLAMMLRAARPDEVHLVLPASLAAASQRALFKAFTPVGVQHLVLTHLDDAAGLGVILDTLDRVQCDVSYTTGGQRVPSDITEACGEHVASLIFATEG